MGFLFRGWTGFFLPAVFLLLIVGVEAKARSFQEPSNCRILECPSYEVVASRHDLEIRRYEKATWVASPTITSCSYTKASNAGFLELAAYNGGWNEQGEKVEMTAPVLVDITPSPDPDVLCNSTFVVRFYLPKKNRRSPPSSPKAFPGTWPRQRYAAVRRFSGFLKDVNIPIEAEKLKASLRGSPWQAALKNPSTYTVAGYNSPFELVDRVNEIMFLF